MITVSGSDTLNNNWPDEIDSVLKGLVTSLERDKSFYAYPPEHQLKRLISVTDTIGGTFEPTPVVCADDYVAEYKEFIDKKRQELEPFTIRRLCWEKDIATDVRFLNYLESRNEKLDARSLRGLVYSIHRKWLKRSILHNEISSVARLIRAYSGVNKAINRWKQKLEVIFGPDAHLLVAKQLSEAKPKVNDHFKYLNLYSGTEFYAEAIKNAIDRIAEGMARREVVGSGPLSPLQGRRDDMAYILRELLSLEELPRESFREGIARIILDNGIQHEKELVAMVKDYILENKSLGDPRMPRNDTYWVGVDEAAKSKVVEWLSSEDISFFFQYVLRDDSDRNHRKDFWLRYVKKLRKSRCWLSQDARNQLWSMKKGTQIRGYGSLRFPVRNSVFVLDFGSISCVEFSEVGAIYVYENGRLPSVLKDFWSQTPLLDGDFKNTKLLPSPAGDHRIIHSGGWQYRIEQLLARHGIRP